ncbi:MAG: hypothetical protein EXX96DRAFT_325182 [Benjaminiella poitrasii]|nr:MAG: hypothetical protein EXX96DRAFT_325182 [Benjaminiella poitrasii]
MSQVREDMVRFKLEMKSLAEQMDSIETVLNLSKDRVYEVEKGLTATQEVNVNFQVLLEKAVHKQKESDVHATKTMQHIYTNLASVLYETGQLSERLTTISDYQKLHQGNVVNVSKRMQEYSFMLEQAQDVIIQSLHTTTVRHEKEKDGLIELYRHRIIKRKPSSANNQQIWLLPQKGLRILLS